MQGFADFSDSLIGGTLLVALSVALGGLIFALLVVPRTAGAATAAARARCAGLVTRAALVLGGCQLAVLALKACLLASYVGPAAYGRFLGTLQCRAGLTRAALAFALATAAAVARRRPRAAGPWVAACGLGAGIVVSSAWLVHGAGRLEQRGLLMTLTVLHQLGAALWVGGLIALAATWRLGRGDAAVAALWPAAVARFSRLAVGAVLGLVGVGLPLARIYVGSWEGLVGTAYGSLVVTKAFLLGAALVLAAGNLAAVRGFRRRGAIAALRTRVPFLLEAEMILGTVLLFTAASLSSQPPARDTISERASASEVVQVFRPKLPSLRTPSVDTMLRTTADPYAAVGGERSDAAYAWSNFSHNVAGLVLLAMSVLALCASRSTWRWARHWPLGIALLGVFVFLRSMAVDAVWPFGPRSFWATTLVSSEDLQHRLAGVLAVTLGLIEWRARQTDHPGRLAFVFPLLAVGGGLLLLMHSHVAFEQKSSYLVQVTHTAMGALAVLLGCGRLLELRLPSVVGRTAGFASAAAMLVIALVLVFYREANVTVPPGGVASAPLDAAVVVRR